MCITRLIKKWTLMPFAAKYVWMPGRSWRGRMQTLSEAESLYETHCRRHINMLASVIGERHFGCPAKLDATLQYLRSEFSSYGYQPNPHVFTLPEGDGVNLIAERPGRTAKTLVIGAHYDSILNCPAANDNGSGVAIMLELARLFAKVEDLEATIRFVAFANEEHLGMPPEHMGSYLYAQHCRENNDDIIGMWSLETLGYFSDAKNSQHYPAPFDLFYPTTGNFVGFIGTESSKDWIRQCVEVFRKTAKLPSEGVAAPAKFKDVGRSDHWGFDQFEYPALMVTDTANFRYPHYHRSTDTPEHVNFPMMARLVTGLAAAVDKIARAKQAK